MVVEITAIDGQAVGPAETVHVVIDGNAEYGLTADTEWHRRFGVGSTFHGQTSNPRQIPLVIVPGAGAGGITSADWVAAAMGLLRPTGALKTITADYDATEVSIEAAIAGLQLPSGEIARMRATALAPSQFWRTTGALSSDTTGTATNNGNAPAAPKITIRPTTGTVVRRRVTLVEFSSRGLVRHPLRIPIDTSGISVTGGDNIAVFDRGQSVPFQAIAPPSATTPIFIECSLLPNETSFVDVVMGGAVSNLVTANQLNPSGFDWAHASFTNTLWIYRNTATTLNGIEAPAIWETAKALKRAGSWHRTEFGGKDPTSVWLDQTAGVSVTGNAAITMISQIKMANANTILHLDANIAWQDSFAQQRRAGEWVYRDSESASVEDNIVLTDAVQVVLYPANQVSVLFDIDASGSPISVALQSGEVPTISVAGSSVAMARINGTLTNDTTGDQIIFEDVLIDADASGGLIIDTNAAPGEQARVYPSLDTSPMYTLSTGKGWKFSNRAGWPLVPGANSWSWSGDGAPDITVEWADAHAV